MIAEAAGGSCGREPQSLSEDIVTRYGRWKPFGDYAFSRNVGLEVCSEVIFVNWAVVFEKRFSEGMCLELAV